MQESEYNIGATFNDGKDEIVFHFRDISTAEENRYTAQFAKISDSDSEEKKAEKSYGILVDHIASWSEYAPTIKENGKEVVAETAPATPADAVRAYFAERTPKKERLANQVILAFRRKMQPDVVFY